MLEWPLNDLKPNGVIGGSPVGARWVMVKGMAIPNAASETKRRAAIRRATDARSVCVIDGHSQGW
jgi:hypothetical protein